MFTNEAVIDIEKPADQIFAFVIDLSQWGAWHSGHIEAKQTSQGSFGVGATFRERFWLIPPIRGTATYQVTAYEPGRRVEYLTLQSPVKAKIWVNLQPTQTGTRVTLGNETQPTIIMRLFQSIFPKMGQQMIEGEAKKLKTILEVNQ